MCVLAKWGTSEANWGWPSMFGSIDCMHWKWKLCSVTRQGKNKFNPWGCVWPTPLGLSCFFGLPGGNNDLNVLDCRPLVRNLLLGNANGLGFWINSNWYEKHYLLADEIYQNGHASCNCSETLRIKIRVILLQHKILQERAPKVFWGNSS